MKTLTAVVGTMLLTLTLTTAGVDAQTIEPVDQVVIVDATGKRLGKVLDAAEANADSARSASVLLHLEPNGIFFKLFFVTNSFAGNLSSVFFESTDCSGTAYALDTGAPRVRGFGDSFATGQVLYVEDVNATSRTIAARSNLFQEHSIGGVATCGAFSTVALTVVPVIQIEWPLTPPYRLQAAAAGSGASCCGDCNGDGNVTVDEVVKGTTFVLNGCPTP